MATEVSICSNALRRLGDDPITSLTDDTERARLCNSFYTDTRDAVLRLHPWNFAITRASLAKLATAPGYGFANKFSLPTNPYCLRVLGMEYEDYIFKVENVATHGIVLLTDEATANIIYNSEKWPIDSDKSFIFSYIEKGSNYLIKEFPNEKNYEDAKDKVKEL